MPKPIDPQSLATHTTGPDRSGLNWKIPAVGLLGAACLFAFALLGLVLAGLVGAIFGASFMAMLFTQSRENRKAERQLSGADKGLQALVLVAVLAGFATAVLV